MKMMDSFLMELPNRGGEIILPLFFVNMRLLRYEGHKVVISPEALALKPFRKIWERDKSQDKNRALSELAFIYFFCDPRSEYMIILDEETRMEEIKKGEGLRDSWTPDKALLDAMELFKKMTMTTSAALLEDARAAVEKIRLQLRDLSFSEVEPAKMPKAIKDASDALTRVPDLIEALQKAEKSLNMEILENARMRGAGEKKIFEDNLE